MSKESLSVLGLEERILLNCARLDLPAQNRAKLEQLLQHRIDWEALFQRSVKQSMSPLLYLHLHGEPNLWRLVPEVMRVQLEQIYERNIERNQLLLTELDRLFAACNAAEIPVLLMKELHLLHTIYHQPGLRPIGDLDLLVPQADFERAKALLAEAGYHPQLSANPYKDKYGFGYHLVHQTKGIWIDLQWNLSQREWAQEGSPVREFRAPIAEVWKRARPSRLQDSRIWRMSWEDLLFHLCVHLEGHGFNEMIQFCDIAEVLKLYGETLDWQSFISTVHATGMQGSVACSLEFVQKVLGVAPPAQVLAALRPDFLKFGLYNACFSTLGRLHTFLDESADDACLPAHALQQWEATVRQTAELNVQTYATLAAITQALADKGLHPVVLTTRGPEQLLPHAGLARTGQCEILVVEKNADSAAISPQWWQGLQKYSSRDLLKKILRPAQQEEDTTISLRVVAPEQALLVLCLRFSRSTAPWQALSMIAEFLRGFAGDWDWKKFWNAAEEIGATRNVALALQSVAQLTSVEVPAAALQLTEGVHAEGGVDLFPLPAPQASAAAMKSATQRIYRLALLSSFSARGKYLINLVRHTGGGKVLPKFWKPVVAMLGFGLSLLRERIQQRFSQPEKIHAYWLEMPHLSATESAVPEPRPRHALELEALHTALAAS